MADLCNIRVVCRVKPYVVEDRRESLPFAQSITSAGDDHIEVIRPLQSNESFTFDRVFDGISTQVWSI